MRINALVAIAAVPVFAGFNLAGCDSGTTVPTTDSGGASSTTAKGGNTSSTSSAAGGSTSQGGSSSTNGGASSSSGGDSGVGGASSLPADSLTMDANGRVEKDSNDFGIQGSWYWYADYSDGHAGLTTLSNVQDNTPPFIDGKGMCVVGKTPGGSKDNYVTWGAGIGLNLNQGTEEDGGTTPEKLKPYPRCFTITLSADSTAPGGILGKLLEANPMPGTTADDTVPQEAPSIALKAGKGVDVCVDNVAQPSWCSASSHKPGDCAEPKNLENGIASIQIQALAGGSGGDINVCVVSIVPKN